MSAMTERWWVVIIIVLLVEALINAGLRLVVVLLWLGEVVIRLWLSLHASSLLCLD